MEITNGITRHHQLLLDHHLLGLLLGILHPYPPIHSRILLPRLLDWDFDLLTLLSCLHNHFASLVPLQLDHLVHSQPVDRQTLSLTAEIQIFKQELAQRILRLLDHYLLVNLVGESYVPPPQFLPI